MNQAEDLWQGFPEWVRAILAPHLLPDEHPQSWFDPDLDTQLHFAAGLVILTDRRLISFELESPDLTSGRPETAKSKSCQSWTLEEKTTLWAKDHAGIGKLELVNDKGRLAVWRYTATRSPAARRLQERRDGQRRGTAQQVRIATSAAVIECPICQLLFSADKGVCPDCGSSRTSPPISSLLRLSRFIRKHIWMTLLGFVLTLSGTGAGLISPYLTMPLLDDILIPYQNGNSTNFGLAKFYLLGLAAASVLGWLLSWAQMYVMSWVSERVSVDLRNQTYAHLQSLSLEYFGGKRTGDLISRVSNDSDRICYFLSVHLLDFASDVLMIVMTAVILLNIDFYLAITTLLPLPLISYMVYNVQNRLRRGFSLGDRAWAEIMSILADTIPGIRVVKAFAQERREIGRFQHANNRLLQANDRVNRIWSFFYSVVVLLTDAGVLVIWVFGIWRVYDHSLTVGALTAFVAYISRFYSRLDSMSRMVSATQRAAASAQRVFGILDRVPKVSEPRHPVHPGRLKGQIELRQTRFRYAAQPVLRGINLSIRPGEMIGLVGPSGAGKTTLINLVCRFYDPTDGAIFVDGTDIRSFPIEEYHRHIGIVLQEPFLFYGTIAENIAYGRPEAARDEIIAAARAARAHEFILRLPNGYDSLVGERGQFLSGGERQRISIARALLIDPAILILDEATSSVDAETEREIQRALANLFQGRTTIAIAHRLSTLQRADRLVVMERGLITEVGSHEELLECSGTYARLYKIQVQMGKEPEEEENGEQENVGED